MALSPDWANLIIHSDASITDMVWLHQQLRELEASDTGVLYPAIHTYKEVPLGGGAIFHALAFINGWTFQLPAGNWTLSGGNFAAIINPVAGCYVERTQSAAYAVTATGAGGGSSAPTAQQNVDAWWADIRSETLLTVFKFLGLR